MLQGCISALVTPMFANGQIDYVALAELVEWQIASGVDGLVVAGSTGEAAALTASERLELITRVVKLTRSRVKIIAGSGTSNTQQTLDFIQQLNLIKGLDYLMCLTPYYVKPTQEGLYQHFAAVAKITNMPLILYNVPSRTGCDLADATTLRLAHDFKNIIGLKDATGEICRCLNLVATKPPGFCLYSGDDASALAFLLCGGDGVISVVSNIRPKLFSQMTAAALAGERVAATKLNCQLLPLYDLLFSEANPIPLKWALFYEQRLSSPCLRLPLTELDHKFQTQLAECLIQIKGEN